MKNKQPALRMYADRALVLPWVSGHDGRDKIGGFVVQGILRFTNQYYLFSGPPCPAAGLHRFYKDNVFIGFAIRTACTFHSSQKYIVVV